VTRRSI